ncbi:MAG: TIGR03016 family PEP-CTERM system-associated outer membrane protein [Haliea sp.]|uniref:TIGR03016 family PEP-CTERM system-associated outer membrane protein n=1 Tax=Haliea sp. TaxID=1932666 RepID=UPI0032ED77B7
MKPWQIGLPAALCGALWGANQSLAAEWDTGAGIAVGGYYTDNVCLAQSGEEDKWVGTARPDVSVRGRGARGNVNLRAAAEYNSLGDSDLECTTGQGASLTNRESVVPSVRFSSDYELVQRWLQLDFAASARQTNINPFAPGGTTSGRDNTDIVYDYTAGALLQRRLAQVAELRLRYAYNEQFNSVGVNGDSTEDRAEFDLDSLPGSGRLSVGAGGRYSKVNYEDSDLRPAFDNTLSSAELRAALQLDSAWQLNALVGQEWNEFTSSRDDIEGDYWDVGVRWTPNPRVEVSVGSGERFFGSTPRADIRYRHKRSEITVSYARTLSFPRNLRVGDNGFVEPGDPFDPGFGELPGDPLGEEGLPTFIGNSPILNERFDLRYRFTARRTSVTLSGSDSRQRRTEDDAEATFRNAAITFNRNLSSLLSANLRLSREEREGTGGEFGEFGGFGQSSKAWRAGLGFSRRLGNDTTLTVAYQFLTQESDFALNDYDENRVTFNLRHAF